MPGTRCGKILEIQSKTSADHNAGKDDSEHKNSQRVFIGMNGGLAVEICGSNFYCCNAGALDSDRYACKNRSKQNYFGKIHSKLS